MVVDVGEVRSRTRYCRMERTFRHAAASKNVELRVEPRHLASRSYRPPRLRVPKPAVERLQFTHRGRVSMKLRPSRRVGTTKTRIPTAPEVLAFSVSDTGDRYTGGQAQIIFEAFQQADGSTSRKIWRHRPGSGH